MLGAAPQGARYREWQPFLGHHVSRRARSADGATEGERAHKSH